MDFFPLLLPGALLTYLLMGEVGPVVLGDRYAKLAGAEVGPPSCSRAISSATWSFCSAPGWTGFYDWARRYTLNTQISMLVGRRLSLLGLAHARSGWYSNPSATSSATPQVLYQCAFAR